MAVRGDKRHVVSASALERGTVCRTLIFIKPGTLYPSILLSYYPLRDITRREMKFAPDPFAHPRSEDMAKRFPLHPKHPERICWGCDKYCPADSLNCGNGSGRTVHPAEMLGEDWYTYGDWGLDVPESKVTRDS